MRQLLNWDEYHENFNDLIYDEIDVNWLSLIIYDVYFYFYNDHNDIINNINNGIDNMIDSVLVDKVEFKCKENMEFAKKKFFFFFMNHLFLAQVICLVFLYII
jgi:hypothetical protein